MITTSSFVLTRTDGTKLYIEIDPLTYEDGNVTKPSGVYQLQATRHDDPAGEYTEDNPGDTTEIGSFAHREEDKHEWEYIGDFLDDDEQAQVAAYLQRADPEGTETRESFYIQAFYHGGMNSFEVTPVDNKFTVAYDGKIIAEIHHNEDWEQINGEPLEEDVFVSIKQGIESKFD